jgi:hypothetical protein
MLDVDETNMTMSQFVQCHAWILDLDEVKEWKRQAGMFEYLVSRHLHA